MPDLAVILPASGSSSRYGRDKLLESFDGGTVFSSALKGLLQHNAIREFFIASSNESILASIRALPSDVRERITICSGGATRAESVRSALKQVSARYEWIAVHDAARPLVSRELMDRVFNAALEHGAAVPALPVHLTIKQATAPLPSRVLRTVPRHELWAMQTPQIMRRTDLLQAFNRCPIPMEQVTDDVQLLELIGKEVWLVAGEERNLKITTPIDLRIATMMLDEGRT